MDAVQQWGEALSQALTLECRFVRFFQEKGQRRKLLHCRIVDTTLA